MPHTSVRKIDAIFLYLGFSAYFTYIEPIVHQRWLKTGEPGVKNHLTIRKHNLAFPRDLSEAI